MASRKKSQSRSARSDRAPESVAGPWSLRDDAFEAALLDGKHEGPLRELLGDEVYEALRTLERDDQRRSLRGGPVVWILPGIMGSKLGIRRTLLDDVLWFDPVDIGKGNLSLLANPGKRREIEALGVFNLAYLLLKLRLRAAGFDAAYHPFDWRLSIRKLGDSLRARLLTQASPVSLVCHSMGGLVARAALRHADVDVDRVPRVVQLGTPNRGSFAPVLALSGSHELVAKLSALDLRHTHEELVRDVFSTLPGLIEMLPAPDTQQAIDLWDSQAWPTALRPTQARLDAARRALDDIPPPDARFRLIAGVGQETVVAAEADLAARAFRFRSSLAGDGTVPLEFARMSGLSTWYAETAHGALPNSGRVADATIDLLRSGTTQALPDRFEGSPRATREWKPSSSVLFDRRRGPAIGAVECRDILAPFAAAPSRDDLRPRAVADEPGSAQNGATPASSDRLNGVVIGRRRQRRIDVRLAQGSIVDVDAEAYVIGAFRGVPPGGAAHAIDAELDGAISDFVARRMFSCASGEVFTIPVGRTTLAASYVVVLGLGGFESFGTSTLEMIGENAVRTLIRSRVDDFATILVGGNCGLSIREALRATVGGFVRGLLDADRGQDFRRITLCEIDAGRYAQMRDALIELATTSLLEDVEITVSEMELRPPRVRAATRPKTSLGEERARYLYVERLRDGSGSRAKQPLQFRVSLLDTARNATILVDDVLIDADEFQIQLAKAEPPKLKFGGVAKYGADLANLVLPPRIVEALAAPPSEDTEPALVVLHDATASRIPWETLLIGGRFPALTGGMARRYVARDMSVAKWLDNRRLGDGLDVLVVVNPTGDLSGADAEGGKVIEAMRATNGLRLTIRRKGEATRDRLLDDFESGRFDIVHYAGHAFFDAKVPVRSGILCAGDDVLSGKDVATLSRTPALMFVNACESARVRGDAYQSRLQVTTSFAESFLRGGVAQYIGTYWPVGDAGAVTFATTFYRALLDGGTIGDAFDGARRALSGAKLVDWADYVHYGARGFRLKLGGKGK